VKIDDDRYLMAFDVVHTAWHAARKAGFHRGSVKADEERSKDLLSRVTPLGRM